MFTRTLEFTVAVVASFVAMSALASPGGRNSAATVTASFADSCRDFTANSTRDISHVETHYIGGPVVKDESVNTRDYAIDGGVGDEIEFAIVKSGTTSQQFECVISNSAPAALLEIKTPPLGTSLDGCYEFFSGGLICERSSGVRRSDARLTVAQ
jgi:hypothetical protein